MSFAELTGLIRAAITKGGDPRAVVEQWAATNNTTFVQAVRGLTEYNNEHGGVDRSVIGGLWTTIHRPEDPPPATPVSTGVPGWTGSPGGPTPPTPPQESFHLWRGGEGPPPDLPPYDAETGTYIDGTSTVSPQESFRLWQQGEGPPPDLPPYDAETGTYLDPMGSSSPRYSTYASGFSGTPGETETYGRLSLEATQAALNPEVVSGPGGGGSAVDYLNQLANQPTPDINIDASFLGDVLQGGYEYTSELRQLSDVAIQDQTAALQDRRDRFWTEAPSRYARAGVIDNLGAGQQQFAKVQDPFVADACWLTGTRRRRSMRSPVPPVDTSRIS